MGTRLKMNREDRAKQFMPFAALKGYTEALRQKERIVVEKAELSEEYAEMLDYKLRCIKPKDMVTVIYFEGGRYLKKTGIVTKIDKTSRIIKIVNVKILFDDIYDIKEES